MQKIRLVIDTNWWVSFVINRFQSRLAEVLMNPNLYIFPSVELHREIMDTLDAPKLSRYLSPDLKAEFKAAFPEIVVQVRVSDTVAVCRDPKDNFLLALSRAAKADYLITSDADLLVLGQFEGTQILKLTDFWALRIG